MGGGKRRPKGAGLVGVLVIAVLGAGVVAAVRETRLSAAASGGKPKAAEGPAPWQRVRQADFGPAEPVAEMEGVSAPGGGVSGWLGVGTVTDYVAGRRTPVVWTSADAERWQRANLPTTSGDGGAFAVARRPDRAVAVGTEVGPTDRDPVLWSTSDGAAWQRVTVDVPPGDQTLSIAAAGARGFAVAGVNRQPDAAPPLLLTSPDGVAWRAVPTGAGSDLPPSATVTGLAVGAEGMVAVGSIAGDDDDAAIWFSADGAGWQRVPLAAGGSGPGDQRFTSVVLSRTGFVAAGADERTGREAAMVWHSADGRSWTQRGPDNALGFGATNSVGVSIARLAGPGPLVAVTSLFSTIVWRTITNDDRVWAVQDLPDNLTRASGQVGALASDGSTAVLTFVDAARPSIWVSSKGAQWHEVTPEAGAFSRATRSFAAPVLTAAPVGLVLFASQNDEESGTGSVALWTSADGNQWARQPDPGGVFQKADVIAATRWRHGVVAVGQVHNGGSKPMVWTSPDGVSWTRAPADQPGLATDTQGVILGIVKGGPGLVAVGFHYGNATQFDAHAWSSTDGVMWSRASPPSAWGGSNDQYFAGACRVGTSIATVGYETKGPEHDGFVFLSPDGVAWNSLGAAAEVFRGAGGQSVRACVPTAAGTVVAGWERRRDEDVRVWTTGDGATWNVVSAPSFGGPADQLAIGLASNGRRVVMVGRDDEDAAVWTSVDAGGTWARQHPPGGVFSSLGTQLAIAVEVIGDRAVVAGRDGEALAVWTGGLPR